MHIPEIVASVRHPLSPGSGWTHKLGSFLAPRMQIVLASCVAVVSWPDRLGAGAVNAHTAVYMDS